MSGDMVVIHKEVAVTTSLKIAEYFGKEHKHVLEDIRKLIGNIDALAEESEGKMTEPKFRRSHEYFIEGSYKVPHRKADPMYYITQDGFNLLVMGYEGIEALKHKLAFIEEFNRRGLELDKARLGAYYLRQAAARAMYLPEYKGAMDAVKRLVDYAVAKFGVPREYLEGKTGNIYAMYNGAMNKAAGVVKGTRPDATPDQTTHLMNMSADVSRIVEAGIAHSDYWTAIRQAALDAIDAYGARYVHKVETPRQAPIGAPKTRIETRTRSGWTRRSSSKIVTVPWAPQGDVDYDFEEAD